MVEKFKVEWFDAKSLAEIYQQTNMQFAFVTDPKHGNKQCHTWALCRDFLHDAVRTAKTGIKSSIYSFDFDVEKNPPLDLAKMRMLVRKKGLKKTEKAVFDKKMKAGLKLLNHYEKMDGVALSKLVKVDDSKEDAWVFTGPSVWMKAPQLVSMYTMLIRLGDKEIGFKDNKDLMEKFKGLAEQNKNGKLPDNDANYLRACWNKFDLVMTNSAKLFPVDIYEQQKSTAIGTFHDRSGIWNFCSFNSPMKELNDNFRAVVKSAKRVEGGI